jgi:hypothetical protein
MFTRLFSFLLALTVFALIHEGLHALVAAPLGEYSKFIIKPYGLEVILKTPPEHRAGIEWLFISGTSNVATIALGLFLLSQRERLAQISLPILRAGGYWLTLLALLVDPLNIAIGPFLYGGDAEGISLGLGIHRYLVQFFFFVIFLANRELVAQKLLPAFGVQTNHPLVKPWINLRYLRQKEVHSKQGS